MLLNHRWRVRVGAVRVVQGMHTVLKATVPVSELLVGQAFLFAFAPNQSWIAAPPLRQVPTLVLVVCSIQVGARVT